MSRNNIPSKTSHCQAFEQSQYYVYEVSDGSAAERPRQICPYIVIACQYRELKEMPILAIESLPELNHKALYCPWRGQLSIRGQLLCNIALRTPYSSTIPAQLPPNLDINHVMGLSDLKKKLPEAAFGKRNYIENEVCFQGVYFSLYEVEISNKDQHKMDHLVENLKEKDLAIIKYLQDQGVLILLTSSALARDDGFDPKEPVSLLALFLFTSSRSVCLRAEDECTDPFKKCSEQSFSQLRRYLSDPNSYTLEISAALGCLTANLQFPHRRKRGAEVLSAEFVHKTQSEPVQKETSAPDDPGLETKRPKTLKNPDVKKVPVAETVAKPMKSKMLKSVANNPPKPQAKKQAESEWKEPFSVLPGEVSSQCHGADSQTSEIHPGGVADLDFNLKGNDYESHALNLLADLALGSCIPSFIPRDSGMSAVSCSPSSDSAKEQQSHRQHKSLRVASDHEYHRVDKLTKGATSPSKALPNQKLPPEKVELNDLASIPREKSPGIFSKKNSTSPSPAKPHALPPGETQEAAEVNKHSFISAEHSYASQMPEHSKKHTYPRGAPYPGPAPSRNGTRNARAGPLVGKVLPFCHQQNSTHSQRPFEAVAMRRRSSLLSPRLKEDFAKSHTVNICGESMKVTCRWEAEYLFNLDSRYTNDALEKTIIRALHGPWDPDLPDDVEEMKLILHMWVALFYSKPSKLLSSTRKVVEHSNPEKYVSINSTGDFLELSDDGEDCFGLETCPADSRSDPDQTPSSSLDCSTRYQGPLRPEESPADSQTDADGTPGVVDSTVSSSSGELPCGEEEPSSTSCPESLSLTERADKTLAVKDGQPAVVPEERVHDISTIAAEEPPKEGLPDATIAPSPFDELNDASKPSAALSREYPCSRAPNSSTVPWRDALCMLRGHGEQQESGSVCLTSLDGATDPGTAPEDQEAMASICSPSQNNLGGSSCLSQRCGGDVCADLTSLSTGESNQEGNKVFVNEQQSSPSANPTDTLDESSGAGDGQDFTFDRTASAGNSEAGEKDDVHPGAEKSPRSDKTNMVMVANAPQEPETSLHHLLESEPPSLVREEMSAIKEHPRQQQSSPNDLSPPAHRGSAPASPPQQDPLPHSGDADPHHHLLERSELGPVLCQHGKSCERVGAAEVSVTAKSPDRSLKPRCAEEVTKDAGLCYVELAESSPVDVLVPGDPGSMPPPPHGHKAGPHSAELDSVLGVHPKTLSPGTSLAPDGAPWSCCVGTCPRCASPWGQAADAVGSHEEEPILPEDLEGGSGVPLASPASFSAEELLVPLCEPPSPCYQDEREAEGSDAFADLHRASTEVGEAEIPPLPFPMLPLHMHRRLSGESLELSDAEDISDVLLRAKQLPSKDRHMGLTFEDLFETFSGNLEQEYFGRISQSVLRARGSYSTRSVDAAGTRTNCDDSSVSSVHMKGPSEDWGLLGTERGCPRAERGWPMGPRETNSGHVPPYVNIRDSQGITKDYPNFVVTKKCQERMGNLQHSKRRSHCAGQSHLLRSLMGTWRGFEEITQHTLDMECLRFHYKLKQILRSGKPPFSTSKSIFPKDFSPQVMSETLPGREAPIPFSLRSRSPLQVTILPSHTWPSGLGWHQQSSWHGDLCTSWQDTLCDKRSRARSRTISQDRVAPFHLGKLKYSNKLKDSGGDIADILDEYAEFNRVMLSRADAGSEGRGPVPAHREAASEWPRASLTRRMAAFEETITDLCSALHFRLHSVAEEACGRAGMFYLVETGKDPFFARVKTLLKKDGHVEMEPLSFCEVKHLDADRLLVVIRNEDISSHIHNVPCLLKLKQCPNVVFAGVDSPEDITGHTYQELFHTGGFVVSDDEVLETVTLGQLKEVVKVLEKLNRSGRWKWLLHYKESKKLREDIRVDANARKKHLILKSCQGADLIEVLHYHACDSRSSPRAEHIKCLLGLQVQHVSARFAVYLTEKPSISREVLESKGILVADVNAFLGTVEKAAAPFRRSYW
ncbi:PREDICTED: protein FAM208B [Cariama cristata]|nr:PREDICTED: protein FAM208B [Cariama cristata]